MSDLEPFESRMVTQTFTPEWVRHGSDIPEGELREHLEAGAEKLECNYPVVAVVGTDARGYGDEEAYAVRAIAKHNADLDEVRRGLQSLMHWVMEGKVDV